MSWQAYTTMQTSRQHADRLWILLLPVTAPYSMKRTASTFTAKDLIWKKESIAAKSAAGNSHNRPFNNRLSCRREQTRRQRRRNTIQISGEPQFENRIKKNSTALQFWDDIRLLTFRLHDNNSQTAGRCTTFITGCDDAMYLNVFGNVFYYLKSESGYSVKSQQLVELRLINWTTEATQASGIYIGSLLIQKWFCSS